MPCPSPLVAPRLAPYPERTGVPDRGGLTISILVDFDYLRPATLPEAVAMLAEHGPEARVLAGGTDLVPWMRDELVAPAALVDLKGIGGLDGIEEHGGAVDLGPLVTVSDLIHSEVVARRAPLLVEMAHLFASPGIRNRATVVGNLCSAVPSCDAGPPLLAYEAVLHVAGPGGERTVAVADWFRGPRATLLETGEIVVRLTVRPPTDGHGAAFLKLGRYSGEDLAQASLAVVVTPDLRYRVAFGAVAPTPVRGLAIERLLQGKVPDGGTLADAIAAVDEEIAPITDLRATAEYRAHMCRIMLRRGIDAAGRRLAGDGPPYPSRFV